MRKVYLLITSALLLLGSSSLLAESTGTASLDGGEAIGIDEAITAWKANGGVLKLESDCEYESTSALSLSKIQTLDLNGLSLTFKTSVADAIKVASAGSLTIIDGSDGKTGSLSSVSTSSSQTDIIWAQSGSTLAIEAGTFSVTNTNGKTVYALYLNSGTTGSISISGGVFENDNMTFTANVGIISGGKFAVQPAYYTPVEGKIYELVDGYYQLTDGTYFALVNDIPYSDVELFNAALSSDESNPSVVTTLAERNVTIPEGKYVALKQGSSNQQNGKITNNGNIIFNANGSAYLWTNAEFENNGVITMQAGVFSNELYASLIDMGATLVDGNNAYAYCYNTSYTQIMVESSIVAKVTNGDVVMAFDNISTALNYSSKTNPAVLAKDCNFYAYIYGGAERYLDLNGFTLTMSSTTSITQGLLSIEGEGTINYTGTNVVFWVYGASDPAAESYSVLNIGNDVVINAPNGYGIGVAGYADATKAYGAKVNVEGEIVAKSFCITTNGSVKAMEGNLPEINVSGKLTSTNEAAIYAAGYAIWNLVGAEVTGAEGIYAKSGTVNISGGTVTATGAVGSATPNCNGTSNTGDAIIMDTNNCYAGNVIVNIINGAEITSNNGYAVQEVVTKNKDDASTAIGLVIAGEGTNLEGGKGSVKMSDDFVKSLEDGSSSTYQWVINGVSGGTYSSRPPVVADGYVAIEKTVGSETYFEVVQKPEEPVAPASQTTHILIDTDWNYAVEYTNSSALVVATGKTLTVKGINVNRADVNDVSKVTVEPGGKLIVGSNGIQTNSADALLLQSDAKHGMGMLLYDGSTTATSPYGKAELYVSSKNIEGGNHIWQHFGIPTQSIPSIEKNVQASFNNWDVKKGWIWDGGSSTLTEPWIGRNLAVNSDEPGQIITFGGQLVGNEDATLTLDKYGYNAFANSYTAPVNLKSIIDGALAIDACTDGAVWVYSAAKAISTGIAKFDSYGADTSEKDSLASMQAFFILHESNSADNIELSYNEAVLGQNTRGADASSYNKATFTVTANGEADDFKIYEGEQFSSTSIDRGYDIKQMNHGFIKIFAKQNGEDYASVATDDAEGVELYIETKQAGEYKLSFSNISEGYEISLTDIVTGTEVEVAEDKVYTFTVDENTTVKRFRFGKSQVSAEEANAEAVKVWANDGAIFVANNAAEANIEIINLSGVVVATAAASGEAVQAVPVAGLASGVYVVRVGTATAKVVK